MPDPDPGGDISTLPDRRPGQGLRIERTEPPAPAVPARARRGIWSIPPLLRDTVFRRYWSGQTVSLMGDQIFAIALPLVAVLALHAGAEQMGLLTALAWTPSLLFALHAGAWADRHGRKRVTMIVADLGRAAVVGSVPLSYAFGALTIGQLYAVAFASGTLSVLFTVSDPALFVRLVPDERYVDGNTLIYGSRALSYLAGPSVGGLLVQILSAPVAVAADALSFLGSAFFLSRIHPAETPPARAGRGEVTDGARFIRHSAVIRSSLASIALVNFFNVIYQALFVLYDTRALHLTPGVLGLVLGAGAVGSIVGAATTRRIAARFGVGRANAYGILGFTAPLMVVPLAGGSHAVILCLLFGAEFVSGLGLMMLDISSASIYAEVIPNELRSRVSGAFQTVNYGIRPLGAVVGGLLGAAFGVRTTLWIATVGGVLGFFLLLPSPVPRYRMRADAARETSGSETAGSETAAA